MASVIVWLWKTYTCWKQREQNYTANGKHATSYCSRDH